MMFSLPSTSCLRKIPIKEFKGLQLMLPTTISKDIELWVELSVLQLFHISHLVVTCLTWMIFMRRQRMKDLLLRARIFVTTSNMKISRCHLADYIKTLHQKACSMIIFPHSANQITKLWHYHCRCCWHFLYSMIFYFI